jgi:quinol monooxygenase YgiN
MKKGITMSQPATETTAMPTTLTLITPTQDDSAELVAEETTLTALEERQNLLAHHVRLVARGMSVGLFVFGSQGGLGKSRTVLRTLADEGVSPVLINSHITPLALYASLYHNRSERVIFFDDVDSIFGSMSHLGLLRSALWGDPRVVTYGSSQLDDLPGSFIFDSRLVFCANVIPRRNDAFKAVLSRCDIFQLDASQEEIVDLMRSVARAGYETLSPDDCQDVVTFIEQYADDRAISLRLLEPSFRKVIYARSEGLDWRPLVLNQLKSLGRKEDTSRRLDAKAQEVRTLHQAIERFPDSVAEQQTYWSKATSKSRASFFRLLSRNRPR